MIDGPGVVVEVDRAKFGKRKFNLGHRVEGVWVVGGVERTPERGVGVFFVPVEVRTEQVLTDIIQAWIRPESIVNTDGWRGYSTASLLNIGMKAHNTVIHSENFVDPITGAHTNTIEGTWNGLRISSNTRRYSAEHIEGDAFSFMWRRRFCGSLWNRMMNAMWNSAHKI